LNVAGFVIGPQRTAGPTTLGTIGFPSLSNLIRALFLLAISLMQKNLLALVDDIYEDLELSYP